LVEASRPFWLHPDARPAGPELLSREMSALLLLGLAGRVQSLTKVSSPVTGCNEFRARRVLQLPDQHLVSFALYEIFLRAHVDSALRHGSAARVMDRDGGRVRRSPARKMSEKRGGSLTPRTRRSTTGFGRS
jgi:hypothetical protein